jgi:transcriptional regulator with XRE-family HTH domain
VGGKRDLDPTASPMHFFGAEVRLAREAARLTLAELGATVPCDGSTVSKVEAGLLAPTERFAEACDEAFPHMAGWFSRFYHDCQAWDNGPFPRWFEDWLAAEKQAATLRIWEPLVVPGLLQTAEYAQALFVAAQADISDEALELSVTARIGRQRIFDKPGRPNVLVVLDELVLHRLIGTPKITYDQLVQVADMSARPYISVQVVPAGTGAHAGLDGAFAIATVDGNPDIMHIDAVEGLTIETSATVRKAAIVFDRVRSDALPRSASRDLILKVAEERWNS